MTRALTRSHFHSSRFLLALADLSLLDVADAGTEFAEKLGLWVDFTAAITLSAVHQADGASPPDKSSGANSIAGVALGKVMARTRADLVNSINRSVLPMPEAVGPGGLEPEYEPYRRYYLAQQREIALKLGSLRTHVRGVLGRTSPKLRKLAALDAALDGTLNERESRLLAGVPVLLEKRFRQLHKSHRQNLVVTQQDDCPDLWMQAGGWLADFCQEMQNLLLAELDLRMQAALGLMEAFNQEITHINE
jgi:hypothetical protein